MEVFFHVSSFAVSFFLFCPIVVLGACHNARSVPRNAQDRDGDKATGRSTVLYTNSPNRDSHNRWDFFFRKSGRTVQVVKFSRPSFCFLVCQIIVIRRFGELNPVLFLFGDSESLALANLNFLFLCNGPYTSHMLNEATAAPPGSEHPPQRSTAALVRSDTFHQGTQSAADRKPPFSSTKQLQHRHDRSIPPAVKCCSHHKCFFFLVKVVDARRPPPSCSEGRPTGEATKECSAFCCRAPTPQPSVSVVRWEAHGAVRRPARDATGALAPSSSHHHPAPLQIPPSKYLIQFHTVRGILESGATNFTPMIV